MKRKEYEKELRKLQTELCRLQDWVKDKGLRVIVVFEGRDAAGKGGTIKAITERVSPRVFRVVALAGPLRSRKIANVFAALHGPFPGCRRSRDLRPQLVQPRRRGDVMGFCPEEYSVSRDLPEFELYIVDGGIILDQVLARGQQ